MSVTSPVRPGSRTSRHALRALGVLVALASTAAPAQALDYGGGGGDGATSAAFPEDVALVGVRYGTTTQRHSTYVYISTPCGVRTVRTTDRAAPGGAIAFTKRTGGVNVEVRLQVTGAVGRGTIRATGRQRGRSCSRQRQVLFAAPSATTGTTSPTALRFGLLRGRDSAGLPIPVAMLRRPGGRRTLVWDAPLRCTPRSASGIQTYVSGRFRAASSIDDRERFALASGFRGSGLTTVKAKIDAAGVLRGRLSLAYSSRRGAKRESCRSGSQTFTAVPVA